MMFGDLALGLGVALSHPFEPNYLRELPSLGLFKLEAELHYQLSWDAAYPPKQRSEKGRRLRQAKLREIRAELMRREEEGELD